MSTFKRFHTTSPWLFAFTTMACILSGSTSPGATAATDQARSVAVSYADLDLSKRAGAETLYRRIRKAARAVCEPGSLSPGRMGVWRDCIEEAVANAVVSINRPTLTALHRASTRTATG